MCPFPSEWQVLDCYLKRPFRNNTPAVREAAWSGDPCRACRTIASSTISQHNPRAQQEPGRGTQDETYRYEYRLVAKLYRILATFKMHATHDAVHAQHISALVVVAVLGGNMNAPTREVLVTKDDYPRAVKFDSQLHRIRPISNDATYFRNGLLTVYLLG